jgi:hypothetical protein
MEGLEQDDTGNWLSMKAAVFCKRQEQLKKCRILNVTAEGCCCCCCFMCRLVSAAVTLYRTAGCIVLSNPGRHIETNKIYQTCWHILLCMDYWRRDPSSSECTARTVVRAIHSEVEGMCKDIIWPSSSSASCVQRCKIQAIFLKLYSGSCWLFWFKFAVVFLSQSREITRYCPTLVYDSFLSLLLHFVIYYHSII